MARVTVKALDEKIAHLECDISRLCSDIEHIQFVLAAMADKMHFGREDFVKFNRKLKKYGTQTEKN